MRTVQLIEDVRISTNVEIARHSSQLTQQVVSVVREVISRPISSEHYWLHFHNALSLPDLPERIPSLENPWEIKIEIEACSKMLLAIVDSGCTLNYISFRALQEMEAGIFKPFDTTKDVDDKLLDMPIIGITRLEFFVEGLSKNTFCHDFIVVDDQFTRHSLPCDCLLGRNWLVSLDAFRRPAPRRTGQRILLIRDTVIGSIGLTLLASPFVASLFASHLVATILLFPCAFLIIAGFVNVRRQVFPLPPGLSASALTLAASTVIVLYMWTTAPSYAQLPAADPLPLPMPGPPTITPGTSPTNLPGRHRVPDTDPPDYGPDYGFHDQIPDLMLIMMTYIHTYIVDNASLQKCPK